MTIREGWRVHTSAGPDGTIHVWPERDAVVHTTDVAHNTNCICGPDLETQDNGTILVTHHSLDGRERTE